MCHQKYPTFDYPRHAGIHTLINAVPTCLAERCNQEICFFQVFCPLGDQQYLEKIKQKKLAALVKSASLKGADGRQNELNLIVASLNFES